jgi:nicotinate-nucleotide adenylyltransferase
MNRAIGLLGGSFNPAHEGHVHLSLQAMKRLGLRRVIWLVSPQNPLKSTQGMAPLLQRVASAEALVAHHPQITVSTLEAETGSHYTVDTLRYLRAHHPRQRFVWLMGADNLAIMHRWHRWREVMDHTPLAIFDRAPFAHAALRSPAALAYAKQRLQERDAAHLCRGSGGGWAYLFMPRHALSASYLRKTLGKTAFLRHT